MSAQYKKDYLTKVIARLDFATALPGIDEKVPSEIVAIAIESFPIVEPPKNRFSGQIKFGPKGEISAETTNFSKEWNYHGKAREKTLCITQEFMLIVFKEYKSFDVLRSDFESIINKLFSIYEKDKDIVVKRFGLRYINSICFEKEEDPIDWTKYLAPKLLPIFDVAKDKTKICRALNNLVLNYGDMLLKFQYGMYNPDYPALIRSKEFILDFDAFYEGAQDKEGIMVNLDRFHDEIEKFFEQCITDKLREVMNQ